MAKAPGSTGNRHGETQLWCAVILNAIEEAQGFVAGGPDPRISDSARSWLTQSNRDFNTVCHLAGLDPVAVRERALKLLSYQHA